MKWALSSYRNLISHQQTFHWKDPIFKELRKLEPIVRKQEIDRLRLELDQAERGGLVLMHAGDCAETFEDAVVGAWDRKIKMWNKFEKVVEKKFGKKALMIGRVAGQYAKPRSAMFTEINGKKIHNYKGDNINNYHDINERQPSTKRLLKGYHHSVATYSYLKNNLPGLYTSHEGLIIPYQQSMTYQLSPNKHYCLSAHMLWIGERTRQLNGGHIEFFRGIQNPIGIKISSKVTEPQFIQLVKTLNPKNEYGKLLIICRVGKDIANQTVNFLIKLKQNDPMHANTFESSNNKLKTRNVKHIQQQLNSIFKQTQSSSLPCGISLECSGDQITQCFGDTSIPTQEHLQLDLYKTKCDPRLTSFQAETIISNIQTN